MSFVELVAEVAEKSGLPKATVATVLRSFQEVVLDSLKRGEAVKLPRFGTFFTYIQKSRKLFGGTKESQERSVYRFRQSRSL